MKNFFYKELAVCPELPQGEFDVICKKIHRRAVVRRFGIMGTVCSVLLVAFATITSLGLFEYKAVHPEVAAELQIVRDYVNGDDLEDQIETYAYYEE